MTGAGGLETLTVEETRTYFGNNLRGLIQDTNTRGYVAGVMTRFMNPDALEPFMDSRAPSVIFDGAWSQKYSREAFETFRSMGDVHLWFAGFYPERLTGRRRIGLKYYLTTGTTAYQYAASAGMQSRNEEAPMMARMGHQFRRMVKAVFEMRVRVDVDAYKVPPRVIDELERVLYQRIDFNQETMSGASLRIV